MPSDYMEIIDKIIVKKAVFDEYRINIRDVYFLDSFDLVTHIHAYEFTMKNGKYHVRIYVGSDSYYARAVLTEKYKLLKKMED